MMFENDKTAEVSLDLFLTEELSPLILMAEQEMGIHR
jgi:hypothetical protein